MCGIQVGWGSPVHTRRDRDPQAALEKLRTLGLLQNCVACPYQGLVKISGQWRNGKHFNVSSGPDFVAGCDGLQ